jgi:hypothetical protein
MPAPLANQVMSSPSGVRKPHRYVFSRQVLTEAHQKPCLCEYSNGIVQHPVAQLGRTSVLRPNSGLKALPSGTSRSARPRGVSPDFTGGMPVRSSVTGWNRCRSLGGTG